MNFQFCARPWTVNPGPHFSKELMGTALQPVAIFPTSLKDNCPRCRKTMTATRCEDFEILSCVCQYSCKQQSGEMKLAFRQQVKERTAQK